MQVRGAGPVALALGAGDAVGQKVDPHAELSRVRRGVVSQIMPVPAAHFQGEVPRRWTREEGGQVAAEPLAARLEYF